MLFTHTVTPECYTLMKDLMQIPALNNFPLAGGTALALQKGNRSSVDIDLFSKNEFSNDFILRALKACLFPRRAADVRTYGFGVFCTIDEVKTDFVYWATRLYFHLYLLMVFVWQHRLRFAMKLDAITGRKVKKDFFDIALLLDEYSIEEGLKFYEKKYPNNDVSAVLKQLTYLNPADAMPDPQMLLPMSWTDVKARIITAVKLHWESRI